MDHQAQHPDTQTPSAATSEESHLPVVPKETIPAASASIAAFISATTAGKSAATLLVSFGSEERSKSHSSGEQSIIIY